MAPIVSLNFGNTKNSGKRIPASKNWCFTLNNYSEKNIDDLLLWFDGSKHNYLFQEEIGKQNTPHLQGVVSFSSKCRPLENKKNIPEIHWEKTRSLGHSIIYCIDPLKRKEGGRVWDTFDCELNLLNPINFYPWQAELIEELKKKPDDRTIHWYWESNGCAGKTAIAKYICANNKAIVVSGKSDNCKNAILQYQLKQQCYPRIIIFDIPRCNHNHISYEALESIKNGLFYSGKYEGGMCLFNNPHLICFANEEPNYDLLSKDRWHVVNILI